MEVIDAMKENGMSIEVVHGNNGDALDGIRRIHGSFYSGDKAQYEKDSAYLDIALNDPRSIIIIQRGNKNTKDISGYILGIPQDMAYGFWNTWDPRLRDDPTIFYIDDLEIGESINPRGFLKLIQEFKKEMKKRGYRKFSFHARSQIINSLIHILKQFITPKVTSIRQIQGSWYGFEEPYDYVEGEIK